jgi:hypothetical protein
VARRSTQQEYADVVSEIELTGSEMRSEPSMAEPARGPVASTSCLVTVLLAAFIALVVFPASLWLLGIACGGT